MQITVLTDKSGEIIGGMLHTAGPARTGNDIHGVRIISDGGQVAVTVDTPEELVGRIPGGPEFSKALRRYVVKGGKLVKRESRTKA